MDFKKKIRHFFTLRRNAEDGFTLVELIVVIAIVAVLGGVAVPAYTGYIEKADAAADAQIIADINKAFAAACMVEGIDNYGAESASAPLTGEEGKKTVEKVTINGEDITDTFNKFYEGGAFKKTEELEYVPAEGRFVDRDAKGDGNTVTVSLNGKEYKISQAIVDAFKDSVFYENVDEMQNQVNVLAEAFGEVVKGKNVADLFGEDFSKYMEDKGFADEDIGNAAVLYVAQNAGDMTPQDIANKFAQAAKGNPTTIGDMLNNFENEEDPLTSVALMYGAVTAFANSDACTDDTFKTQVQNVNNGTDLFNVFASLQAKPAVKDDWAGYIGSYKQDGSGEIEPSADFTKDMNGFLGAMDAIDTVSPSIDPSAEDVWTSSDIDNLLNSLLGTNE